MNNSIQKSSLRGALISVGILGVVAAAAMTLVSFAHADSGRGSRHASTLQSTVPPTSGIGAINGVAFTDLNNDKVLTSGEAGLSGITVTLLQDGRRNRGSSLVVGTTTTNASGAYSFSNLGLGSYIVEAMATSGSKLESSKARVLLSTTTPTQIVNLAIRAQNATTTEDRNHENENEVETHHSGNGNESHGGNTNSSHSGGHGEGINGRHD